MDDHLCIILDLAFQFGGSGLYTNNSMFPSQHDASKPVHVSEGSLKQKSCKPLFAICAELICSQSLERIIAAQL